MAWHFTRYGKSAVLTSLCIVCTLPFHEAIAQDAESANTNDQVGSALELVSPEIDIDTQREIDEITVVAPRSLVRIKRQIEQADVVMYEIANNFIDDPMYKTYCRRETRAGTNIKRRICLPGYERELMEDAWETEKAMARMGEGSFTFNYKLPEAELRQHRENMKQKMIEIAAEQPELEEAIYKRAQLQRDYDMARLRRRQEKDD